MGDEVEVFPADKHKSFLQDGSITLGVIARQAQSTKAISLQYICNISRNT